MRAQLENLKEKAQAERSFLCYEVRVPYFKFLWHYHPEFELTYIIKGEGRRLVGNQYENFRDGDFVLLGAGLPHTWVTDSTKNKKGHAIVIQFSKEILESFLKLPEFSAIASLLNKADRGMKFKSNATTKRVIEKVHSLLHLSRADSVIGLMTILDTLSRCDSTLIVSRNMALLKGEVNEKRINKVFQFVQNNYRGNLLLTKAAATIHLSESAFCKFFKRASGETFSDYVNKIRIDYACSLLLETDKPVNTIAAECGFENISYFNRIFLKKKKVTPRLFRNQNQ